MCIYHRKISRIVVLLIFYFSRHNTDAQQICTPDIFSIYYQGNAACAVNNSLETPQNEILAVGNALQINGGLGDDAWITKFSARGIVLWAKRYMLPGYNSGSFYSAVMATDSSYFVTGRFGFLKRRFVDNVIEELYSISVLIHLDKFGNLLWTKSLTQFVTYNTNLNNIIKTSSGDFILTASIFGQNYQRILVFRMDITGKVKWSHTLYSDELQFGSPLLKNLRDGNIILGGAAYGSKQGWWLATLDYNTGSLLWQKGYFGYSQTSVLSIKHISELPDGSLRFYSSFSNAPVLLPPGVEKAVSIVTNVSGTIQKATAFYNDQPGCVMLHAEVSENSGQQLLLMDDGSRTLLVTADRNDLVTGQKAYGNINGNLIGSAILKGLPAKRILFAGRTRVAIMGLLKTEDNGDMSCMETTVNIIKEDVLSNFGAEKINIILTAENKELFADLGGGINKINYSFTPTVDCEITCCTDIKSDTTEIKLCNSSSYQLPDNSIVKESGTYYSHQRTQTNCDSLAFYNVSFSQIPQPNLGPDDCMDGREKLQLEVDSTYMNYNWMGINSNINTFVVTSPGIYWVSITNHCGTGKDSIEILMKCEFEIFIPSGFTPNGDGLNDVFRVPKQNKNKLVSLKVYNRWGQLVFQTTKIDQGWDGKFKSLPQSAGVYAYSVVMKTLNHKEITHKGTVTLIR